MPNTQVNTQTISGTLAERDSLYPARVVAEGTFYHASDSHDTFVLRIDAVSQVRFWDPVGGGAASDIWPPYVVSAGDPLAHYALPSAAVAAAVANGHGPANPATVLVHPGVYAEPAPLSLPGGIGVVALDDDANGQTVVANGVNVTGGGATTLDGMTFTGQVTVAAGAGAVALFVRKCALAAGLVGSVAGLGSTVTLVDSSVSNAGGKSAVQMLPASNATLSADRSTLSDGTGATLAAQLDGPATHVLRRCRMTGAVETVTTALLDDCNVTVVGANAAVQSTAAGVVTIRDGVYALGTGGLTSGGVAVNARDFCVAGAPAVGAGTTTAALQTQRVFTRVTRTVGAGTLVLTVADLADEVFLAGVPGTVQLPQASTVPSGARTTFVWDSGGGMTFTPFAGNTVAGGASQALGIGIGGATFQSDPATGWDQVGAFDPMALSLFIDTAAGNDSNSGTAALPLLTWNAGAWPRIASLRYTDVIVTYLNTTPDASPTGAYVLPIGVRVTLMSPWGDSGLGPKTAAAGSTTTNIVVTGGGLVVNAQEGTRVRWLPGARNTGVYSIVSNTATALVPGVAGLPLAPLAGDPFVLEREGGGWAPAVDVQLDASNGGTEWRMRGFKVAPSVFTQFDLIGASSVSGAWFAHAATSSLINLRHASILLGQLHGAAGVPLDAVGTDAHLCVYVSGTNGAPSNGIIVRSGNTEATDLVLSEAPYAQLQGSANFFGVALHGTSSGAFLSFNASQYVVVGLVQQGAGTVPPVQVSQGASGQLKQNTFSTTLAADAVTVSGAQASLLQNTGVNATAGAVGLRATNGATIADQGGNTIAGALGAQKIGAAAAGAWPAGGTLTTDLTLAIVTANTSQGCLMRS